jgi:PleD family two-component response regulator
MAGQPTSGQPTSGQPASGQPVSGQLLLVDDEPGLRQAVQAYLEDEGFTVHVASNAKDGLDMLQRISPDLVGKILASKHSQSFF